MDLLAIALAKNDRERANKTIHMWIYVYILHSYNQSRIIPDSHGESGIMHKEMMEYMQCQSSRSEKNSESSSFQSPSTTH